MHINTTEVWEFMKHSEKRAGVTDFLLLLLTILFPAGLFTVFKGCPAGEDGSWMSCHWAEMAVLGISCVLLICALIHLFVPDPGVKTGIDAAVIPMAALSIFLPKNLIRLCMMADMRCQVYMRPFAAVLSALILCTAFVDLLLNRRE